MSDKSGFRRCTHCRGFYEADFDACKWCGYDVPALHPDGQPRHFPDRKCCREIQIEEYNKLPAPAHDDPMGPPLDYADIICNCLHCGPDGHPFEAIEMRWLENENMWACPCTTCGGRGFDFDIHPRDLGWECVECRHRYAPPDGRYISANCKCPKCGCTLANGWWEDEYDDDDEAFPDEDALDIEPSRPVDPPWQNDVRDWQPGDDEMDDEDDASPGEPRLPDDIDFPHQSAPSTDRQSDAGDHFDEDDIPF